MWSAYEWVALIIDADFLQVHKRVPLMETLTCSYAWTFQRVIKR